MSNLLIKGGTVVNGSDLVVADVLIEDGQVIELGPQLGQPGGCESLDATGCYVMSGLVDLHCHMREPGFEESETIETAARAGARGGYTCLVAMPNTVPAIDSPQMVEMIRQKADRAVVDVQVAGAITQGRKGECLAEIYEMAKAGVRIFTDDGAGVQDSRLMLNALRYSVVGDLVMAQHCEEASLATGGHINDGVISSQLGISSIPREAEETMAYRDVLLAKKTGARLHLLHVSTSNTLDIVRQARAWGVKVTCEVTPHHLLLSEDDVVTLNPDMKVNPPLRTLDDCRKLALGLLDGTIDAVATDHAPHHIDNKTQPFEDCAFGMTGLETAFGVIFTLLTRGTVSGKSKILEPINEREAIGLVHTTMSMNPAKIAGVSNQQGGPLRCGALANVLVVDPRASWVVDRTKLSSKSKNTPFDRLELFGKVIHTISKGRLVVKDGELL